MFGLCKYKNVFGKPNTGIHRFRIFGLAAVDIILTLLLAYILQLIFYPETHYLKILAYCFLLGIIIHRAFCVHTPIDKFLFL
jgi:hypothetical protein